MSPRLLASSGSTIRALCAAVLLASCARSPEPVLVSPDSVTVRIGQIDSAAIESAAKSAPHALPARTEQLIDAFWRAGCLGAAVETPLPDVADSPDVVCSLPGRTQNRILVLAHLDESDSKRKEGEARHWSGVALLPFLYQALAVETREHTFVFAAFGQSPKRTARDYLSRLGSPDAEAARAIVDLQSVDPAAIWFATADAGLRRDFIAASMAVGRPLATLRSFLPLSSEGHAAVATLTLAAGPPGGGAPGGSGRRAAPVKTTSESEVPSLQATARLVAVFLAYADETLRLRSEPVVAPAAPAPVSEPAPASEPAPTEPDAG